MASDLKVRPAGFKFTGATLIPEPQLQAQVAEFQGKELDFRALGEVATKIRRLYVEAGYPLTDVYFPEQSFAASGGTVEFAIVEARLGDIKVIVGAASKVREGFIRSLVESHLRPGEHVTQLALDRSILLLRDLVGESATAEVSPGKEAGQADVTVRVSGEGQSGREFAVGIDNFGTKNIGEYRLLLTGSIDNLLGYGDTLTAAVQPTDRSGTTLYRIGFRSSIGPLGTKLNLGYSRSNYVLGGAFSSLNASGDADILTLGLVHPLVRSRPGNLFLLLGADSKRLRDEAGAVSERRVALYKIGLLGNRAGPGIGLGATTGFGVTLNGGRLDIKDTASLAQDQANTGPRTDGSFRKFSYELQRVEFLSESTTMTASLTGQRVSRNLTSAEKLSLAGPSAVRGYLAGSDTVVDEGNVLTLEVKRRLGIAPLGAAVHVSVFYDHGSGTLNKTRNATTNSGLVGTQNRVTLDSLGIGATVGVEKDYFISAAYSRRLGGPVFTGTSDSKGRFWVSAIKQF